MFVIEMSTDALLLSKFDILGVNDAVAVFKDDNIPTICDDPDTTPFVDAIEPLIPTTVKLVPSKVNPVLPVIPL
jgi:hypothetical protein